MGNNSGLLKGVRVIECSLLGPAAITSHLIDLGAEVIKVEPPQGDYVRQMTWPIVEGDSLMHLHINRGKRSITLDLKNPEAKKIFFQLAKSADVVVEAMRPGTLEKLGLGYEALKKVNPRVVFITISGYGMTGPYAKMPSHGVAYDTWAGLIKPEYDEAGFCSIPEHPSMGIHAGPLFGAFGILAGIISARETGTGCRLEIAQSDAAAYMDWYRSESWRAYERPQSEVTGNASDNFERRAPGTAGMKEGVRYQIYESSDGHVLFMASEREFWENFCRGVDRIDLFDRWPGEKFADHARNNTELRTELRKIFLTRTSAEWISWSSEVNTPIAPVNTPENIARDPQFQHRLPWITQDRLGADQLPTPIQVLDHEQPIPDRAPTVGQHTDSVLAEILGYDSDQISELRAAGVFGTAK